MFRTILFTSSAEEFSSVKPDLKNAGTIQPMGGEHFHFDPQTSDALS